MDAVDETRFATTMATVGDRALFVVSLNQEDHVPLFRGSLGRRMVFGTTLAGGNGERKVPLRVSCEQVGLSFSTLLDLANIAKQEELYALPRGISGPDIIFGMLWTALAPTKSPASGTFRTAFRLVCGDDAMQNIQDAIAGLASEPGATPEEKRQNRGTKILGLLEREQPFSVKELLTRLVQHADPKPRFGLLMYVYKHTQQAGGLWVLLPGSVRPQAPSEDLWTPVHELQEQFAQVLKQMNDVPRSLLAANPSEAIDDEAQQPRLNQTEVNQHFAQGMMDLRQTLDQLRADVEALKNL